MSDQNPPEQGAFGSPAPGSEPATPGPSSGTPADTPPAASTPPPSSAAGGGASVPPPPPPASTPSPEPQPPVQGGPGAYATSGGNAVVDSSTGFFPALFDFSFNSFVTPKIVRFVYVLAVIWAVVSYVIIVLSSFFQYGLTEGLLALIFGPIVALIWIAIVRIGLEFGISVVRMSEDVHKRLPQG
jgi:hypothetical protein